MAPGYTYRLIRPKRSFTLLLSLVRSEIINKIAIVLVADINNIVGYLYALDLGDNIDLLSIFVDKKTRYQHIGTDLIESLKKLSLNKTITLEVSSKNEAAIALYKKSDFKEVGMLGTGVNVDLPNSSHSILL
jgi:ribosomal protein S18 acetylase RimI-like enzyme